MANNVLLGALPIVEAQTDYTGGGIVSSPIDMVTLPTDSPAGSGFNVLPGGPSGGGGGGTLVLTDQTAPDYIPQGRTQADIMKEFEAAKGKPLPADSIKTDETPKPGISKKNMLLIGIGALVLGYLVLRKK